MTSNPWSQYPDLSGNAIVGHHAYTVAFWSLFAVYSLYTASTFALFLYCVWKFHDKALLERSVYLTCIQTFFGYAYSANALLHSAITKYPCFVDIWLIYVSYLPWAASLFLAMGRYLTRKKVNVSFDSEIAHASQAPEDLESYLARLVAICAEAPAAAVHRPANPVQPSQARGHNPDPPRSTSCNLARRGSSPIESDMSLSCHTTHQRTSTPLLDISLPGPAHPESKEQAGNNTVDIEQQRQSAARGIRLVEWRRRFSSTKYVTYVIVGTFAASLLMMILFTIFSREMSLKHIHYNCIRGWEFIPITAITGLFDVIACPTFVVLAWPLQDGLGIRTTLVVASVLGIGFWAASLTWRLVRHPADVYISGAFFFFIQIVYVHTCNVVVPLIASLRLAFRKRRKADATLGESGEAWVWSTAATNRNMQYGPDRDSFLRALQDSAEYEKIKRHAQSCFCEELVLFLHVFVALKQAIFAHFQEQHRTSAEHARSAATAAPGPPSSRESLPKSLSPWRPHTTMGFFGKYLDPGSSNRRSHSERTQRTSAERSRSMLRGANHDLSSRSTGIVDALQHAAPNAGFDGSTLVPEEHRHVLGAVIRTFILPDSVLAVNTSGSVLSACQKYLAGDQLVLGTLDKAKDEVLELLYSNVYQRL